MKLCVLLDLDNTLIHSIRLSDVDKVADDIQEQYRYVDMGKYYRIFERPHLQEFLDYLFKHFTVSVWTAASKDYATFIVDNFILVKPERKLDFIFFSHHTKISDTLYNSPKNLRILWEVFNYTDYSANNTIIIDDLFDVYDAQPYNTVRIKYFDINLIKYDTDSDLLRVLSLLKQYDEKLSIADIQVFLFNYINTPEFKSLFQR